MTHDNLLKTASVFAIVLATLHLADDVVRGFEPGGLENLRGIAILATWLCAALLMRDGWWRHGLLLLGSLLAIAMAYAHLRGAGVGGALAHSPGGYFFVWTLFGLGVSGMFALVLVLRGMWGLRRARAATTG